MKLLIATDGSKHATEAVAAAGKIFAGRASTADLIHVAKSRGRAANITGNVSHQVPPILATHTTVKHGSPARVLIEESKNYDVIAVGAQSHRGEPVGLGPVASRVLEHATSSVLVGRPARAEEGLRVLMPVDGSDSSVRAVEQVTSLMDLTEADVTLLHVIETPWVYSEEVSETEELGPARRTPLAPEEEDIPETELLAELEREGDEILNRARGMFPPSCSISVTTERGVPSNEILGVAELSDYDLIVMAASGTTDLKHQMLGSVSYKVAWNAPCSVLVIRSSAED